MRWGTACVWGRGGVGVKVGAMVMAEPLCAISLSCEASILSKQILKYSRKKKNNKKKQFRQ